MNNCQPVESRTWEMEQYKPYAIAFVFNHHIFCPPRCKWKGVGGSIAKACHFLDINYGENRVTVERVLGILEKGLLPLRKMRAPNKKLLIPPRFHRRADSSRSG